MSLIHVKCNLHTAILVHYPSDINSDTHYGEMFVADVPCQYDTLVNKNDGRATPTVHQ